MHEKTCACRSWFACKKKDLMCLVLKYQSFLVPMIFLTRMMCNKNHFCKTLTFSLSKITYLLNLWKVHGWSIFQFTYVQTFFFHVKRFYLIWWKRQNKNIYCQNWKNVILQQLILIYGQREHMMVLPWSLAFWLWVGNQNTSQ